MQSLDSKIDILRQIDITLWHIGTLVYNNYVFGTTQDVDMVYVLKLERARRLLLQTSSAVMTDYVKQLLTSVPYG